MDKNYALKNYTLYPQKGPSINDVTALGVREGVSRIMKNCVTSFMDDPKVYQLIMSET